ncbi:hypothetical protein N7468_009782 [Penicillium chermesinum]|uniref:SWIM-type domain-containing protein n=1 Tax=Penicillium chermesinum TaxID=63820 RepID=A0A9W9ND59_9EURO|nr:uncharacterized protein N7468_009782 [Penicillium chermesinum]KAJ5216774.1 hypothetical protein N7468_009782 [Penicillium chermesinum]KAJ6171607.1 hypothetical protein N7470_000674 [Penicillium chermesinum]
MAPPSLPRFVDQLITELIACHDPNASIDDARDAQAQNFLSTIAGPQLAQAKSLMLTLHCLFPNDLLPALDILDRRLVRRLVRADRTMADQRPRTEDTEDIFLVMSASSIPQPGASSTTHVPEKGYEVRLDAWNCTCPTFTLSAFRDLQTRASLPVESPSNPDMWWDQDEPRRYPFGGTLACAIDLASPPVCKHVLASLLFARSPQLGGRGENLCLVSAEELAGWCAG